MSEDYDCAAAITCIFFFVRFQVSVTTNFQHQSLSDVSFVHFVLDSFEWVGTSYVPILQGFSSVRVCAKSKFSTEIQFSSEARETWTFHPSSYRIQNLMWKVYEIQHWTALLSFFVCLFSAPLTRNFNWIELKFLGCSGRIINHLLLDSRLIRSPILISLLS